MAVKSAKNSKRSTKPAKAGSSLTLTGKQASVLALIAQRPGLPESLRRELLQKHGGNAAVKHIGSQLIKRTSQGVLAVKAQDSPATKALARWSGSLKPADLGKISKSKMPEMVALGKRARTIKIAD